MWRGNNQTVGVALESDTTFLVKSTETESISSKIVYQGPIEAPIRPPLDPPSFFTPIIGTKDKNINENSLEKNFCFSSNMVVDLLIDGLLENIQFYQ